MKNYVKVMLECPYCHQAHFVICREDGFNAWQSGALIQRVFPELSVTERESLISHMCPDCQDKFFGIDEE